MTQSRPEQSIRSQNELRGMGRREQLKKKLTELWMGIDEERTTLADNREGFSERRHRIRFWRNKTREVSAVEHHPNQRCNLADESTRDSEPFTLRHDSLLTTDETARSLTSETCAVIHSPHAVKCNEDQEVESHSSETKGQNKQQRFARRAAISASPLLEPHESWDQFSPTTEASSSNDAETFSAVDANFTPVTPMPFTASGSGYPKLDKGLYAAQASSMKAPPIQNKIRFAEVTQQSPFKMNSESEISMETCSKFRRPLVTEGPLFKMQKNETCSAEATDSTTSNFSTKLWEHKEEESWIAKVLKEYCPVRLRKNKRLNFDSEEFRLMQANLTLKTLVDQELRDQDKKLIFRPSLSSGKSLFRSVFHFEQDADILENMEHFILCNEGLIPLFRGSRPAVRKHFIRRWHNHDRDRIIVCEQLMEKWSQDKTYLTRLMEEREKRQEIRLALEKNQESDDKLPPMSFFVKKMLIKMSGRRGRVGKPPKRGSKLLVYRKEPLFGVPYFEKRKQQFKGWIKDLMLSI